MIDPKALDAAFGKVLADVAALLRDGDVIAIDGKALRGACDKGESARSRMMVSAYAARLRLTRASTTADHGTELDVAPTLLSRPARMRSFGRQSLSAPWPETRPCGHRNTLAAHFGDDGVDTTAEAASKRRYTA